MSPAAAFQRRFSLRLAAWAAVGAASGAVMILWAGGPARSVGLQAASWAALEAAAALALGARRRRPGGGPGLRRGLWLGAGLALLAAGAALFVVLGPGGQHPTWRAHGWAALAQAAFLVLFLLIHAQRVPTPSPQRCAEGPTGDEHRPFLLVGGRPGALLVHGFPGSPADMLPLGQSLQRSGWTARGLLLPGFGADPASLESYRARDGARCVRSALAEMRRRHSPLLLVGFSLGASLAVTAASEQALDGLVLLAPYWRPDSWLRHAAGTLLRPFLPRYLHPLRGADLQDPGTRELLRSLAPGLDPDDPQAAAALRRLGIPLRVLTEVLATGSRTYGSARRVSCPTLIVQGGRDEVLAPDFARRLSARFHRQARYLELPSGHRLLSERGPCWSELEQAVLEFAGSLRYAGLQRP